MEIIWFIPLAGMVGLTVWQHGNKWLKRYLVGKPKPEEDKELQDLSEWEKWAKEGRERKDKELTDWQAEYQEVLQKLCKHRYKDSSYRWWRCVDCAHEHEWEHTYGCTCTTNADYGYGGIADKTKLYRRDDFCPTHGRPRFVANEMHKRGKLTITESLLWDTEAHGHYLPSPAYDYWDKRELERLTKKAKEAKLDKAITR